MRLPVAIGMAAVAMALAAAALDAAQSRASREDLFGAPLITLVSVPAYAAVGALVLRRHPNHAVGWIFLVSAVVEASNELARQYASLALFTVPELPAGIWVGWYASWVWFVEIVLLAVALPVLFPTGRVAEPRWRAVLWLGAAALALMVVSAMTNPGPLEGLPAVANPLGTEALRPLGIAAFVLLAGAIVGALASALSRFRRTAGVERQQMKWLVYAMSLFALTFIGGALLTEQGRRANALVELAIVVAVIAVPVAAGVAILRYRLYDIDVIINRTLVYGATVATLSAGYFIGLVALQALLRPLAGGSELAIAAATLGAVGLFQPLRSRIQRAVDRRFYREKYDAERTLDAFAMRLRAELDLEALRGDLLQIVNDTVQPAHASIWLRDGGTRQGAAAVGAPAAELAR
jgi:hypothetical protein